MSGRGRGRKNTFQVRTSVDIVCQRFRLAKINFKDIILQLNKSLISGFAVLLKEKKKRFWNSKRSTKGYQTIAIIWKPYFSDKLKKTT